jgi:probable addiction module antidote protein
LRDDKAVARISNRIDRLALGNPGEVKSVGEGVSEKRPRLPPVFHQARQGDCASALWRNQANAGEGHQAGDQDGKGIGLMVTVAKWDAAEVLTSPERIAAYLEIVLEDDDPEVLKVALGNIARAKGMAEIAKKAGIRRTSLYRALSPEGNPEFATVAGVLKALGLRLSVTQEGTTRRRAPARSRGATKAKSRTAA